MATKFQRLTICQAQRERSQEGDIKLVVPTLRVSPKYGRVLS